MNRKITLMSIREAAATGLLSEYALRKMVKQGEIPAIYVGRKALINYDALCDMINRKTGGDTATGIIVHRTYGSEAV